MMSEFRFFFLYRLNGVPCWAVYLIRKIVQLLVFSLDLMRLIIFKGRVNRRRTDHLEERNILHFNYNSSALYL